MLHELAKELKGAGFPQELRIGDEFYTMQGKGSCLKFVPTDHDPDEIIVCPTLSDLIREPRKIALAADR
jgi:hypothetical protein